MWYELNPIQGREWSVSTTVRVIVGHYRGEDRDADRGVREIASVFTSGSSRAIILDSP